MHVRRSKGMWRYGGAFVGTHVLYRRKEAYMYRVIEVWMYIISGMHIWVYRERCGDIEVLGFTGTERQV